MGKYRDMSKQEKLAWLALLLFSTASAYLGWCLFVGDLIYGYGIGSKTGQRASYAFSIFLIGHYLAKRKKDSLFIDERDRRIAAKRGVLAYLSLMLMLILATSLLGFGNYEDFIHARSQAWVSAFLMLMVVASAAIHAAVGVFCYWRDRQ